MSLINDALRKVHAHQAAPARAGMPAAAASPAPPAPQQPKTWVILVAVLAAGLLFAAGAGLVVWGWLATRAPHAAAPATATMPVQPPVAAPEQVAPPPPVTTVTPAPPAAPAPPVAEQTAADPMPAPAAALPPAAVPEPIPETGPPAAVAADPATPVHDLAPVGTAPVAAPAPPARPPRALPEVEAYLAGVQVRGILSGGQRVLLFLPDRNRNQAFNAGSTIHSGLGIRIVQIDDYSITFTDHGGHTYTKPF
jgi:hypothetical protein